MDMNNLRDNNLLNGAQPAVLGAISTLSNTTYIIQGALQNTWYNAIFCVEPVQAIEGCLVLDAHEFTVEEGFACRDQLVNYHWPS